MPLLSLLSSGSPFLREFLLSPALRVTSVRRGVDPTIGSEQVFGSSLETSPVLSGQGLLHGGGIFKFASHPGESSSWIRSAAAWYETRIGGTGQERDDLHPVRCVFCPQKTNLRPLCIDSEICSFLVKNRLFRSDPGWRAAGVSAAQEARCDQKPQASQASG